MPALRGEEARQIYGVMHQPEERLYRPDALFARSCGYLVASQEPLLALDGTIEFFRDSVFNYPTFAEAYKVAALDVMNKLRAFILRPDLRAVLGQSQPRFSLQHVFTERRSLLVRLPKGELGGEAAALLGSLVVQQVWQATLARSAVPARSRARKSATAARKPGWTMWCADQVSTGSYPRASL